MATNEFPDLVEYRYRDPATDTNYSAYFRDLGSVISFALGQLGPNVTPSQVLSNLYDAGTGKPLVERDDVDAGVIVKAAAQTGQSIQEEPEDTEVAPEPVEASVDPEAAVPTVPLGTGAPTPQPIDVPDIAAATSNGNESAGVEPTDSPTPPSSIANSEPLPTDIGTATPTPATSDPAVSITDAASLPAESAPLSVDSTDVDSEDTDFDSADSDRVDDGPVTAETAPSIGAPINAENSPA